MRRATVRYPACVVCMVLLGATSAPGAPALTEDVPIVGGTAAFAQALGISPPPDAPRFVSELTRLTYNVPEGKSPAVDAKVERLTSYLEVLRAFQSALGAAQSPSGGITLSAARQKPYRDRLNDLFDIIGFKLREKNRVYSVERASNKDAAERVRVLKSLGIDLDQLQTKLNAGQEVRILVPVELVPVPFDAKTWSDVVFQRPVASRDLVAAILGDRNAALLCRGLAGLDDPTLEYIRAHPAILTRLYEHEATAFGAFADSLRIRNGAVAPPGGDAAIPLWEAVLDEKVTRPERFVRELFSHSGGRMAYLYSTIDHLDPARRAFALGLPITDTGIRQARFKALADVASSGFAEWQVKTLPFGRAVHDLAMLLARVRVRPDGSLTEPRTRVFWSHALDSGGLPDEPARQLRNLHEDGDVDAAWLAERVVSGPVRERRLRFEQLTFGQRAFAGAEASDQPDALVGVRAYPRFAMLMLALERLGAGKPATFAVAARHADRLAKLDPNHAFVALSQFQGAIALLTKLVRVHSLEPVQADALVTALAAATMTDDGWYQRSVAAWFRGPLAQALGLRADTFDGDLIMALAGSKAAATAHQIVNWEGHRYRVDFAEPERRRLQQIRDKTGRVPLETVFALDAMADTLARPALTLAQVQATASRLKDFPVAAAAKPEPPPGVDPPRPAREIIARAAQNLSKITKAKDVKNAADTAEPLGRLVDTLLADSVRSLVYALALGDPDLTVLPGTDLSRRHDFGFAMPSAQGREDTPWAEPGEVILPGAPRQVRGALVNLDVALAASALRQVSARRPDRPPVLIDNERTTFAVTALLLNPFDARDESRDAIVDAIARGTQRIQQLGAEQAVDALDRLREEIATDGWRRRAVQWSLEHHADPRAFFSLAELLQLGRPPNQEALDAWGTVARRGDSCICLRLDPMNQWFIIAGRPVLGTLGTQMPDLNLRVAIVLRDLGLPATLARDVVLAATQDFIDEAAPTDSDDWLTLVRTAGKLTRNRIEDYVAALSANGPLVPDDAASTGGKP